MTPLANSPASRSIDGWILDAYPADQGQMAVWVISQSGERIRLIDTFQPNLYVSTANPNDLDYLLGKLYRNQDIATWQYTEKYAKPTDQQKSKVLELTLKDARKVSRLTKDILKLGDYLKYEVSNCDLRADRGYFFSKDLFPLAHIKVQNSATTLTYELLDSADDINYTVPPLRIAKLEVEMAKAGKIGNLDDRIGIITLTQDDTEICIDSGDEACKIQQMTEAVRDLDPDFLLTHGGDDYLFPYLIKRATENNIQEKLILSRDPVPFAQKTAPGRTLFSYGHTFFRPATQRLYGRIHVDESNTFVLSEAGFDGLVEIARTCRVPLHTAARNSIGSSMSSLQFYQAIKDDVLIPRNKSIPEAFKTGYELLVGDRGGFVFEPRVGAHDFVGEVDFSSMYPSLMANNNISAETVLCKCCPDSPVRIPELNYHICTKRRGIVPKTLRLIVDKRLFYKRMKDQAADPRMRQMYDNRQIALKWILVTCFGYLGYKNAKFGTIDGHIGVCAFGREALLNAAHTAEERGFRVIHGIVDSMWLKKEGAPNDEYKALCETISEQAGVPINFEGRYKWIAFLPSRTHPRIGVLNRYFGVMENGKVKVRGIEVRRRDTPRFVFDAQTEMINALAKANNTTQLHNAIPEALNVVRDYRAKLIAEDVSIGDLIVTKHMSKKPEKYRQHVSQVIAAEQLIKEGAQIHAGNSVKFLFTNAEHKSHNRRVRAAQLLEEDVKPDVKRYLTLLYAAAANLLSFEGYTIKTVHDAIQGRKLRCLTDYSLN